MPHPKNHMKLTGDTHLPDVGFEPLDAEQVEMLMFVEEEDTEPRVYADGWVGPAQDTMPMQAEPAAEPPTKTQAVVRTMERMPAKSPWIAMGVALLFGWMAARTFRALQK
jgi:hypothetical protein